MIAEQIMDTLKEIIETNKTEGNVYNVFFHADKAIRNKEVIVESSPNINQEINQRTATSIFWGLYFRKNESEKICLTFGHRYLDTYQQNSCVHYTMLMHEYRHLYDYYSNPETFFKSNEKERFHFELKARKIEVDIGLIFYQSKLWVFKEFKQKNEFYPLFGW
ncbi:hypothetical protein K7I13_08840 [Brucepastera parasyntrophica]|uniref:hypothetical protein n=1 Tax=Brucepastera parasyntrophica TaxID=2880008 RepID=UPI0021092C81|nr:hypothetical protein [Brucepastera parasyntrophica]ULQ58665.1 hypothetical protein K7I13_08840 [Brucepastera parasyntrophica]